MRLLGLTLLVGTATLGCGAERLTSPTLSETVGPLTAPIALGTRWTYRYVDSVEFGATPFAPFTFDVTAAKDTLIESRSGVVLQNGRQLVENLLGTIAMARASNGILTASTTRPGLPAPGLAAWRLQLPYPVTKGMLFNFGWVVTSVDTTLTTPYGVVRCGSL